MGIMTPENKAIASFDRKDKNKLPGGKIIGLTDGGGFIIRKPNGERVEIIMMFNETVDEVKRENKDMAEAVIALTPIVSRIPTQEENMGDTESEANHNIHLNDAQKTRFWVDGNLAETFRTACLRAQKLGHGSEYLAKKILTRLRGENNFTEEDVKPLQAEIGRYFPTNFTRKTNQPKKPSI